MRSHTLLLLFCFALVAPITHAADGDLVFVDVYGGYAWNMEQDGKAKMPVAGNTTESTFKDIGIQDSAAFGGRLGFWLRRAQNIGIAIDASNFDSDADSQPVAAPAVFPQPINKLRVANTAVTFDLIFRHRMGRFTPYLTGGAGIMVSDFDDNAYFGTQKQDNTETTLALKGGAGMSYSLSDRMEIFGEYRYVYSDPQYDLKSAIDPATANNTTPTNVRGTFEMDIESHQLYSGISFRF